MKYIDCPNQGRCSQRATFWVDKEGAMASVESRDIVGCELEAK